MDTTELCLGNYVLFKEKIIQVKNVYPKGINAIIEKESRLFVYYIKAREIDGIKITTDYLMKLGFRYFYNTYEYRINQDKILYVTRKSERFFVSYPNNMYQDLKEVMYIHELQNFLFFYRGIRLKFKGRY